MKKYKINKKILYIVLSIIIVSVFSLTIAYALLATSLTISGSSEIVGTSWNITLNEFDLWNSDKIFIEGFFDGSNQVAANGISYGSNPKLVKEPTISGTSINDIRVSLVSPGDAIVFYYTVTNNGTIPAKVESITQNIPSFSSSTNNMEDIELISDNWISMINLYDTTIFLWENALEEDYILCPGETIYFEFGAKIDNSLDDVPSSNITISNLGGTINFVQTGINSCN